MAFKSVNQYNEERFGNLFLLRNDGDSADVIFLYRNVDDVLVADVHYLVSDTYRGYAHCLGKSNGCPACNYGERGIRNQTKLFIPLYNIDADEIQFFDRSIRFEAQLKHDVFDTYPNPSQCVYRITRHGAAGSADTTYEIKIIGKNTIGTYDEILAKFNARMPDYYETICKDLSAREMSDLLGNSNTRTSNSFNSVPSYTPKPRVTVPAPAPTTSYSAPPVMPDVSADSEGQSFQGPEELDDEPVDF